MQDTDLFQTMANAAPFAMWRAELSGACTFLNNQWLELTGQSLADGLGDGWTQCVHPDDKDMIVAEFIRSAQASQAYQVEYRVRRSDGSFHWVMDSATPLFDADGQAIAYVGSLVHIGDRREWERDLLAMSRRLRIATRAANIGVWDWDLKTNLFTCSDEALAIFGFAAGLTVSFDDFRKVIHPDDLEQVRAASAAAMDPALRSLAPYRYRITRLTDGAIRWIVAHGEVEFRTKEGTDVAERYVGTFQDVTDDYAVQEMLRDNEANLRLAMQAAGLVMWELDLASSAVTASPELKALFGFAESDAVTLNDLRLRYAPGEQERLERLSAEAQARGETSFDAEFHIVLPDSSDRWVLLLAQAAPPVGASGPRALGVLMDVTARKRNEAQLANIADELKHRVKNILTVVLALATQTFERTGAEGVHLDAFLGRMNALGAATDAVTLEGGASAPLDRIIAESVRPYRDRDRDQFSITGSGGRLSAQTTVALGMALHELGTNAVKYGALSTPEGTVHIEWVDLSDTIAINWREIGGPAVHVPTRRGFGSRLLERGLAGRGTVDLQYKPEGVECSIVLYKEPGRD